MNLDIRILESPEELEKVERLQRLIWSGNDTEIVPVHLFRAVVHGGGLVIGAFSGEQLVGFVFGFLGADSKTPAGKMIHVSHMAGVHPEFRDFGLGFKLKRAQWQMARKQGLERIIWTYDPLQSRNANLNIAKLGAVCSAYIPNYYGVMRDAINDGMPSDRFQVDWWVNSNRVRKRLNVRGEPRLQLSHYLEADIPLLNSTKVDENGLLSPNDGETGLTHSPLFLLEIPADFQSIKSISPELALRWKIHVRKLFTALFSEGYIVTDFIFLPGSFPRGYYILSNGEATL